MRKSQDLELQKDIIQKNEDNERTEAWNVLIQGLVRSHHGGKMKQRPRKSWFEGESHMTFPVLLKARETHDLLERCERTSGFFSPFGVR